MQQLVVRNGNTDQVTTYVRQPPVVAKSVRLVDERSSLSAAVTTRFVDVDDDQWSLFQWCWEAMCFCCPYACTPREQRQVAMPFGGGGGPTTGATSSNQPPPPQDPRTPQPGSSHQLEKTGGISREVYQKITEVDNQTSTLTAGGVEGLSARIVERFDYQQSLPDGTPEVLTCQTVELIKRPGQSLGLFLREGDGVNRGNGVFVSRFGDGSELRKYGEVLRPGDEVLTVNNVDVSRMSIDEVVVIMSIPRRLLLRLRFNKHRREPPWLLQQSRLDGGVGLAAGTSQHQRPVVVVKKQPGASQNTSASTTPALSREDSKESGLGNVDGAECRPTPTAKTSLGLRARQELAELEKQQRGDNQPSTSDDAATLRKPNNPHPHDPSGDHSVNSGHSRPRSRAASHWTPTGYPSETPRQFPLHSPRLLDGQGRPVAGSQSSDTVSRTARVPPPKLAHHVRRVESWRDPAASNYGTLPRQPSSSTNVTPSGNLFSPRSVASDSLADYQTSFVGGGLSTYGPASAMLPPLPPKPALRRPMVPSVPSAAAHRQPYYHYPSTSTADYPITAVDVTCSAYKSNSLPRRGRSTGGRTVKWRNDVTGGGSALSTPIDASATDSDGAISAPEFGGAPTGFPRMYGGSSGAQQRSRLGRNYAPVSARAEMNPSAAAGRTIDDIFSSREYRNWAGVGPPPPGYFQHPAYYAQQQQQQPPRQPRIPPHYSSVNYDSTSAGPYARSSSLPPRGLLSQFQEEQHRYYAPSPGETAGMPMQYYQQQQLPQTSSYSTPYAPFVRQPQPPPIYGNLMNYGGTRSDQAAYDRLHVSPVASRRNVPLRTVGVGWNADEQIPSSQSALDWRRQQVQSCSIRPHAGAAGGVTLTPPAMPSTIHQQQQQQQQQGALTVLTGLLIVHILEGRALKIPDKQKEWTEELYCVLEVDGEHRARTGVTTPAQRFKWHESFEIETMDARQTDFYIYSWHPQYRHKLCHQGSLKLLEAYVIDRLKGDRTFALNLEPRGQLLIRVGFLDLATIYRRPLAIRRQAYFGVPLTNIIDREGFGLDVPILLKRLVEEIERRGVDTNGIYLLCGSTEKKRELRYCIEQQSPSQVDLSADSVPDTNVLTSVIKDYLRELPEPLVPECIYQMLSDASAVSLPNDREGNVRLMLGVIDCMPRQNKCTLMVLMDHFKCVTAQSPHNGMSPMKLSALFAAPLLCTAAPKRGRPPPASAAAVCQLRQPTSSPVDFLDAQLAAEMLTLMLDVWPGRARSAGSSDSSGSENSTINLTNNGELSLIDVWMSEHQAGRVGRTATGARNVHESHC